uniref:UPAR/Ly6 domain-containing protein n=1 Tax=Glossina brevipalpis TaxID=37001 RepID=A0A1A9WK66_9MUSC
MLSYYVFFFWFLDFSLVEPSIECYSCSFPRDWECNALQALTTKEGFLRSCNDSCSVLIGQDGIMGPYAVGITLTRDCHPIQECSTNGSICCQCLTSRCNVNNLCENIDLNNTAIAIRVQKANVPVNFWLWISSCMTLIVLLFRDF